MANKTLKNTRLLILRQLEDSLSLSRLVKKHQGSCINWPALDLIKTAPPTKDQQQTIQHADFYIFISKPAAIFGFQWLQTTTKPIFAVGKGTAKRLKEKGLERVETPFIESSEGLLEMEAFKKIKDKRIIIFKGEGGRGYLSKKLKEKGAKVTSLDFYKRKNAELPKKIAMKIKAFSPNFVHITSIAVAQSLDKANQKYKLLDKASTVALVASERIKNSILTMGFAEILNVDSMRDDKIIEKLQVNSTVNSKG